MVQQLWFETRDGARDYDRVRQDNPLPVGVYGNVPIFPADTTQVVQLAKVTTPASTAVTRASAIGNQQWFNKLLSQYRMCGFILDVTAASSGATDTLDVYVDLSFDGAKWFNGGHFTQVLGNGGVKTFVAQLTHPTAAVNATLVSTDASAGTFNNLWAPHVRVGYAQATVTAAAFTFTVTAYMQS